MPSPKSKSTPKTEPPHAKVIDLDTDHPVEPSSIEREQVFARLMSSLFYLHDISAQLRYVAEHMGALPTRLIITNEHSLDEEPKGKTIKTAAHIPSTAPWPIFSFANLPWNFEDEEISLETLLSSEVPDVAAATQTRIYLEQTCWCNTTDVPPEVKLPVPLPQCNSRHWDELADWSNDLQDALEQLSSKPGDATSPRLLGQLQREVAWLTRFVKAGSSLCAVMSDFSYSSGARPARKLSHVSRTLLTCVRELNEVADTFADEVKKNPEAVISHEEKEHLERLGRDSKSIERVTAAFLEKTSSSPRDLTPKDIGKLIHTSYSTVIRVLGEMERLKKINPQNGWRQYTKDEVREIVRFYRDDYKRR